MFVSAASFSCSHGDDSCLIDSDYSMKLYGPKHEESSTFSDISYYCYASALDVEVLNVPSNSCDVAWFANNANNAELYYHRSWRGVRG